MVAEGGDGSGSAARLTLVVEAADSSGVAAVGDAARGGGARAARAAEGETGGVEDVECRKYKPADKQR